MSTRVTETRVIVTGDAAAMSRTDDFKVTFPSLTACGSIHLEALWEVIYFRSKLIYFKSKTVFEFDMFSWNDVDKRVDEKVKKLKKWSLKHKS